MHWIKVIPHYKESTAYLFLVWTAKRTLFSKAPLCRKQEPFFFCDFPWHLCILPLLKFFSSCPQKSFSPVCTSTFALFTSGTVCYPIQNLHGSDLYSLLLPSSLALIPFWIYFRPVKNMSSIQFKLPFPPTRLLEKESKSIKPSFLWDAWGWQSRVEVPVPCQGHVLPIRFVASAFHLLILSWVASGSPRPEKTVRAFPAPPVISPLSNPKSLTQGGSCGSVEQWNWWPALI